MLQCVRRYECLGHTLEARETPLSSIPTLPLRFDSGIQSGSCGALNKATAHASYGVELRGVSSENLWRLGFASLPYGYGRHPADNAKQPAPVHGHNPPITAIAAPTQNTQKPSTTDTKNAAGFVSCGLSLMPALPPS